MSRGKRPEAETPDFTSKLRTVEVGPRKGDPKKDILTLTIPELGTYGALNAHFREIESWQKGRGGDPIREAMTVSYIKEGVRLGCSPGNAEGIDGNNVVIASLVYAKKATTSAVEREVAARFDARNIRLEPVIHAEKTIRMIPEVYRKHGAKFFNKFMAACHASPEITKLLAEFDFKGIDEIYEIQQENSYRCIGDNTVSDIFLRAKEAREEAEKNNEPIPADWTDEAIRELLILAASPVITVRQYYGNLTDALLELRRQLCPTPADIEEAKRAAEAKRKAVETPPKQPKRNGAAKTKVTDPAPVKLPVGVFAGQTGRDATRIARASRRR